MEELLNEHMPVRRKRRAAYFWLLGLAFFIITSLALFSISQRINTTEDLPTASTYNTEVAKQGEIAAQFETADIKSDKIKDSDITDNANSTQGELSSATEDISKATKTSGLSNSTSVQKKSTRSVHTNPEKSSTSENISFSNKTHSETDKIISINRSTSTQGQISSNNISDREMETSAASDPVPYAVDPLNELDLIAIAEIHRNAELDPIYSAQLIPHTKNTKRVNLEVYAVGQLSKDLVGGGIGINLYHRVSQRFALATGLEYAYHDFDIYNDDGYIAALSEAIFVDSKSYSSFLSEHSIASANFIASTSTIYFPIAAYFSLNSRIDFSLGIKPGIQIYQKLSFAPVATTSVSRNPSIGNDGLTAKDFLHKKSVAVVHSSLGINYHISNRISTGIYYHLGMSDLARGINYSSSEKLERISAGEIDRNFYSIDSKEIRINIFELRLAYRL